MKRKAAPDFYAPRVKPVSAPVRTVAHPSQALASALVRWMDRGDTPPSLVLAQGLMLARSSVNDGFPVEHTRPGWHAVEGDNRVVMGLLDRLKAPNVDKAGVIAPALKAVWVDKRAAPKPTARAVPSKTNERPRMASPSTRTAPPPVVVVRRAKVLSHV